MLIGSCSIGRRRTDQKGDRLQASGQIEVNRWKNKLWPGAGARRQEDGQPSCVAVVGNYCVSCYTLYPLYVHNNGILWTL